MTTATYDELADPTAVNGDQGDVHLYCCNPDLAYCGIDISTEIDVGEPTDDQACPLCLLAEAWPCPDCGQPRRGLR